MSNIIVILIIITLLYFSIKSLIKSKDQGKSCCGCSIKSECSKNSCD